MNRFALIPAALLFISGCSTMLGIKESSVFDYADARKISTAIDTDNLEALKQIFSKLPKDPKKRVSEDQRLLDQALQIVASKGEQCKVNMAEFLFSQGARADYYVMSRNEFNGHATKEYAKYKIPLCKNYLLESQNERIQQKKSSLYSSQDEFTQTVKSSFIKESYNYFVEFLNNTNSLNSKEFSRGLEAYHKILNLSVAYGKELCEKNSMSEGCLEYAYIKKLPDQITSTKRLNHNKEILAFVKNFRSLL